MVAEASKKGSADDGDTKKVLQFPAPFARLLSRALPVDDVGKAGTATIQMMRARPGRVAFSKIGGSTLQLSASAPNLASDPNLHDGVAFSKIGGSTLQLSASEPNPASEPNLASDPNLHDGVSSTAGSDDLSGLLGGL
jgi:hypothetical protein